MNTMNTMQLQQSATPLWHKIGVLHHNNLSLSFLLLVYIYKQPYIPADTYIQHLLLYFISSKVYFFVCLYAASPWKWSKKTLCTQSQPIKLILNGTIGVTIGNTSYHWFQLLCEQSGSPGWTEVIRTTQIFTLEHSIVFSSTWHPVKTDKALPFPSPIQQTGSVCWTDPARSTRFLSQQPRSF